MKQRLCTGWGWRNTRFRGLKGVLTSAPYQLWLNLTVSRNLSRNNTALRDKLQEQISLRAAHLCELALFLCESALFLGESALFLCEFALFSSTALPARNYNFFSRTLKRHQICRIICKLAWVTWPEMF